jgi:fatty-acyl-CoA synthase/long-chain acyl-CoA synthetase
MADLRSESLRHARIQVTTLGDLLLLAADRYPDSPALIFPGLRVTYAGLAARALARARSLQALGVRPREHVGMLLPTCVDFVEMLFAISLCGAVAVP